MKIKAFITHKAKERISDCQDRFAINKETKIVAVSDGVSQSIFSAYWAQLLVEHYCAFGKLTNDDRIALCGKWKNHVKNYIEDEKLRGHNPWRAESNLEEGLSAGATLCGVRFNEPNRWSCDVIGDSCLIVVNKNNIDILSSEDKQFDNEPDYIDSHPNKKGRGDFKTYTGTLSETSKLILVSDPFSDFLQKNKDDALNFTQQLIMLNSHKEYTDLVDNWRRLGMKGDDSTIVVVEWDGSADFNVSFADNLQDMLEKENEVQKEEDDHHIQITIPQINVNIRLPQKSQSTTQQQSITKPTIATENQSNTENAEQVIQKYRCELQNHIRPFVADYIKTEVEQKKLVGCKSIINFVLSGKTKKTKELAFFLEDALSAFMNQTK